MVTYFQESFRNLKTTTSQNRPKVILGNDVAVFIEAGQEQHRVLQRSWAGIGCFCDEPAEDGTSYASSSRLRLCTKSMKAWLNITERSNYDEFIKLLLTDPDYRRYCLLDTDGL